MTPQEFKENVKKDIEEMTKQYEEIVNQFDRNEIVDIRNNSFFTRFEYHNVNCEDYNIEEIGDAISDLVEKWKDYRNKTMSNDFRGDNDWSSSYHAEMGYVIYLPANNIEAKIEKKAKEKNKELLSKSIKPSKTAFRSIDCKLMELWIDGKIDSKTLSALVYSDCKL